MKDENQFKNVLKKADELSHQLKDNLIVRMFLENIKYTLRINDYFENGKTLSVSDIEAFKQLAEIIITYKLRQYGE
jgi:hypothetical protein